MIASDQSPSVCFGLRHVMALIGDRLNVLRCLQLDACPRFTLVEERVQVLSCSTWTAAVQAGSGSIFSEGWGARGWGAERTRSKRKRGQGRIVCVGITMYMCEWLCVMYIYIYIYIYIYKIYLYIDVSLGMTSRTGWEWFVSRVNRSGDGVEKDLSSIALRWSRFCSGVWDRQLPVVQSRSEDGRGWSNRGMTLDLLL